MARQLEYYIWSLCSDCTIRNCRKEPKPKTGGFYCNKRRVYKGGNKLIDAAASNNPFSLLETLWKHGMTAKETKKGLVVVPSRGESH